MCVCACYGLPAAGAQLPSMVLRVELSSASISFSNSSPLEDSLSPVRYSRISFFFWSGVPFSSTSSSSSELKTGVSVQNWTFGNLHHDDDHEAKQNTAPKCDILRLFYHGLKPDSNFKIKRLGTGLSCIYSTFKIKNIIKNQIINM